MTAVMSAVLAISSASFSADGGELYYNNLASRMLEKVLSFFLLNGALNTDT